MESREAPWLYRVAPALCGVVAFAVILVISGVIAMNMMERSYGAQRRDWGAPVKCTVTDPGIPLNNLRTVTMVCPNGLTYQASMAVSNTPGSEAEVYFHSTQPNRYFIAHDLNKGLTGAGEPPLDESLWSLLPLPSIVIAFVVGIAVTDEVEQRRYKRSRRVGV